MSKKKLESEQLTKERKKIMMSILIASGRYKKMRINESISSQNNLEEPNVSFNYGRSLPMRPSRKFNARGIE